MNDELICLIRSDFKNIKLDDNDVMTLVIISLKFFEKYDYNESSSILIDIYKKTGNKEIENLAKKVVFMKVVDEFKEKIEANFNKDDASILVPSWLIFECLVFNHDKSINKLETENIIAGYIKNMISTYNC